MPAKKKRRGGPRRRPYGQAPTTDAGERGQAERDRQLRREAARQRREAIRRKAIRRRYVRNAVYVLAGVAIILVIAYGTTRTKHGAELTAAEQALLAKAASEGTAAGCGPVQTIPAYSGAPDQAHIGSQVPSPPPLTSYESTPPVSGPHAGSPLGVGVYDTPPDVYRTIHSLEHGAAIVWYDPSASGSELDSIKAFFDDTVHQDHVIVAPYDYPDQGDAGKLPTGKQMVLVSWHHMQVCSQPSLAVAFDFVARYRFPPPAGESYKGDAPEQGAPI